MLGWAERPCLKTKATEITGLELCGGSEVDVWLQE